MNNKAIYFILTLALMISFTGCEEYLDIPVEAGLTEDDIFSTYKDFQGFQDQLPVMMKDYTRGGARRVHSLGGEAVAYAGFSVTKANLGLYARSGGGLMQAHSIFFPHDEGSSHEGANFGLYSHMWKAVRIANICLAKLAEGEPVEANQDQKNWLKGQALFYRAFWHYEFVRIWGTIPYVDTVIPSGAEYDYMNRHWSYEKDGKTYNDCQAVFERINEDMQEAADLLPSVWDDPIINWGRPTRAAALGYIAKSLQYSASPLFNQFSTGVEDYDDDLLARCIVACQEVIDEAKSIVGQQPPGMPAVDANGLTRFEDYQRIFVLRDGNIQPGTPEVLWKKPNNAFGAVTVRQTAGRAYGDKQITNQDGAQGNCQYADKFEMIDGTRYRKAYDSDATRRWQGRDPRFYKVFYVHGDTIGTLVVNQATNARAQPFNCFFVRKYFADGVNNPEYEGNGYATPYLRLADIYLTYAEAAYELSGDYNAVPAGGSLSAADAINIIRARAGMPNVASTLIDYNYLIPESEEQAYVGNLDPFRVLYRNERAVELSYEGHYWYDIRRWKIAHYKDGTPIEVLKFDILADNVIDDGTVERMKAPDSGNYVFKDAHYWMPFLDDDVFFSETWEQNPGW